MFTERAERVSGGIYEILRAASFNTLMIKRTLYEIRCVLYPYARTCTYTMHRSVAVRQAQ